MVSQPSPSLAPRAPIELRPVDERPALRRHAAWRQVACADAVSIQHDLEEFCDSKNQQDCAHIAELLEKVWDALGGGSWPWSWFQGALQERTFLALHEAQWRLLMIMNSEQLLARLPWLVTWCGTKLGMDDQRVRGAQDILRHSAHRHFLPQRLQINGDAVGSLHASFRLTSQERATVAVMVRDAYARSDENYAATRGMRNRILMLTGAALAVLGLVIAAGAVWQWRLTPTTTVAVNGTIARWSELPVPAGAAAFLAVGLLGCLGAFLSGIRSVSRTGGTRNPFSLSWWQTWLKLPVGALSAIVGVFALQSRAFPAVPATGWTELLMWAVAFGAAQQAITRFVDVRVRGLVGDSTGGEDGTAAVSLADRRSPGAQKSGLPSAKAAQQGDDEGGP